MKSLLVDTPWKGDPLIHDLLLAMRAADRRTPVTLPKLWMLKSLAMNALFLPGEIWELGVYQGGSAWMLDRIIDGKKTLRLFDTFEGMPEVTDEDLHERGDFSDTSLEGVKDFVGDRPDYRKGFVPDTFAGLDDCEMALVHIDLDLYEGIKAACEFCYPRARILVFDDYGSPTCPGARKAVDEFFVGKPETPISLSTGQCFVVKLPV